MNQNPTSGDKVTVTKTCVCSRFTHERTNYPRNGYRKENEPEYTLQAGEEVTFIGEWANLFGSYWRVQKGDKTLDIEPENFI
jgi:hypothetical protein